MPPTTVDRVPRHTSEHVNQRIRHETDERVRQFAAHPAGIDRRLRELDEEWDIERILETNASALAFTGVVLGITVDKRWLALPRLRDRFPFPTCRPGLVPADPDPAPPRLSNRARDRH